MVILERREGHGAVLACVGENNVIYMYMFIYIYTHVCVCVYIYIYIYINDITCYDMA